MTKKKSKKKELRSWVVRIRCTVEKEVVCEDCTEVEAVENTFGYAVDEQEIGMSDWEVLDVKPNN